MSETPSLDIPDPFFEEVGLAVAAALSRGAGLLQQ